MYSFLLGSFGGIIASLSFPPFNIHYLIWFSTIFLYHVCSTGRSIKSALVGWALFFSIFNLLCLPFDIFLILSVSFVLQVFIFALVLSKILRSKCAPSFYVLIPSIWVLLEFLQDRGFLGIPFHPLKHLSVPWLSVGVALHSHPLRYIASILGVWGLSFVIFVFGGVLYRLLFSKRLILFSIIASGLISTSFLPKPEYQNGTNIKIGLVQPCIREDQARFLTAALSRNVRLSGLLFFQRNLDMIVWPFYYLDSKLPDDSLINYVSNFAKEYHCYIVVGFNGERVSVYSLDGEEIGDFKGLFILPQWKLLFSPYLSIISGKEVIEAEGFKFAVIREVDIGHPFILRELATKGANLIVGITSDSMSHILRANVVIRALEVGLYFAFSNNLGPSLLISPNGGVRETPPFVQSTLFGEASKMTSKTIFVKVGHYWIIFLITLLFVDYLLKLRYSRSYTL